MEGGQGVGGVVGLAWKPCEAKMSTLKLAGSV